MPQRLLLGPQRPVRNLHEAISSSPIPDGPIAVISAGWQEAEGDIDDVYEIVKRPLVDVRLYHRAEEIFATDKKFFDVYRRRQDRLQELQRLYRIRLRQLMLAARQIRRAKADPAVIAVEQRHAISQIRALDRHQLHRIDAVNAEFDAEISLNNSALVAEHVAAIEKTIADCQAILITGGNVLVLLNRLRMFGMQDLLASRHVVAWSAGAMILSDLIVLYHDKSPQGRRDPEVLGAGLGVLPGYIFLPDAKRRLKENDTVRVGLFSSRFAPSTCVTLDNESMLQFDDDRILRADGVGTLTAKGRITGLRLT